MGSSIRAQIFVTITILLLYVKRLVKTIFLNKASLIFFFFFFKALYAHFMKVQIPVFYVHYVIWNTYHVTINIFMKRKNFINIHLIMYCFYNYNFLKISYDKITFLIPNNKQFSLIFYFIFFKGFILKWIEVAST